ncbi:MAG: hypothetical protein M9921_09685 [Fimbriimonadaceae bacterium]|nr:hypothetical protein [Chthonomonadaceae bacterium]MCO5297115.1 hypothetical protein [Fimbriimonadaceae bacterium]
MSPVRFLVAVVAATAIFGIALDLVTAHVAVEYFTVHHPHVIDSDSPIAMALIWGVGASWWFGLGAGFLLWWVNRRRPQPVAWSQIFGWIVRALAWLWALMMGILLAVYGLAGLVPMHQRGPTFEHDRRLMAVALTHATEYVLGGVIVVILLVKIVRASKVRTAP